MLHFKFTIEESDIFEPQVPIFKIASSKFCHSVGGLDYIGVCTRRALSHWCPELCEFLGRFVNSNLGY